MTLLSLSHVIVLLLWERWGRLAQHIDPGHGPVPRLRRYERRRGPAVLTDTS